jgi:hypothetical protein
MAMRKYLGAFVIRPEFTGDDAWRYQTQAIAPFIRFLAAHRLSKYFVRRVVNVEAGDPKFYDLVEIYWVDTELEKEYYGSLLPFYKEAGLTPPMAAWTRLAISVWNTTEEVCEVIEQDDSAGLAPYKTMDGFQVAAGVDKEDFWSYLNGPYATAVRAIAGDLIRKFTIHRPVAVAAGDPSYFYAINEIWWTSREARDAFARRAQGHAMASGKGLTDDFVARTAAEAAWTVEIEARQLA